MEEVSLWRVNVERKFFQDPRFRVLVTVVGDQEKAVGMAVCAWFLAQPFWLKERGLVPTVLFQAAGYGPLVTVGLAELRPEGVYVKGIEAQFEWIEKMTPWKRGAEAASSERKSRPNGGRGSNGRFAPKTDGPVMDRSVDQAVDRSLDRPVDHRSPSNGQSVDHRGGVETNLNLPATTAPNSLTLSSSLFKRDSRGPTSPAPVVEEDSYPAPYIDPRFAAERAERPRKARKPKGEGVGLGLDPKSIPGVVTGSEIETAFKALCRKTWETYFAAYGRRYKKQDGTPVEPQRPAKVNAAIVAFCKEFGAEAPEIISFFLSMNKRYYLENTHQVWILGRDGGSIRTQWLAGRTITTKDAQRAEGDDVFQRALRREEEKRGSNVRDVP